MPRVLIIGDSITSWTAFPESIAEWLAEVGVEVEFVGPYRVGPAGEKETTAVNDMGVGGYTSIAFVRELGMKKEYGRPKRPEVLRFFAEQNNIPDVVVLEIGVNDVASGFPEKMIVENFNLIIQFLRAKNPGVAVVLTGIPPFSYSRVKKLPEKIEARNKLYASLANELATAESPLVFAPYPTVEQAAALGLVPPAEYIKHTYTKDRIHPDHQAALAMAYNVAAAIVELTR